MRFDENVGRIYVNRTNADIDFQMYSTSYAKIFNMDAGLNQIGFGTTFGTEWLKANATEIVFNETSIARNFRVETDGSEYHLFINGTNNRTGFNISAPTSVAHFKGSFARSAVTKTATYTLAESDYCVYANGTFTLNLPTAVGITDREYNVINIGTGTVTIDPNGSETISGDSTLDITTQWTSVVFRSDGSNWIRCS